MAGSDYTTLLMALTFNAATTSHTVTIMTTADTIVETDEMLNLSLTSGDSAVDLTVVSTATLTINDQSSMYIVKSIVLKHQLGKV